MHSAWNNSFAPPRGFEVAMNSAAAMGATTLLDDPASTLTVALGGRSYPIHIGEGLLARIDAWLPDTATHARAERAVVVTNPLVGAKHLASLQRGLDRAAIRHDVIVLPDGEAHKDWSTLYDIHTRLLELKAERGTMLIALGGGVIGDLAGFAAATFKRGMPLVQIPTSLLAQVDSSVGGKTAVNHPLGKNMIGAFYQPSAVIIDTATLSTLPDREYVSGLAEVVKYGAIRSPELFAWLEDNAEKLSARDSSAVRARGYARAAASRRRSSRSTSARPASVSCSTSDTLRTCHRSRRRIRQLAPR